MKNGQYKEITELGLGKEINGIYFSTMNRIGESFKKGCHITEPVAVVIKGDSKMVVPQGELEKNDYADQLRIVCHFLQADAVILFCEASQWTGTEHQRLEVIKKRGTTHGHPKSKNVVMVTIETKGKTIIGLAEVEEKGNKRMMKAFVWDVQDTPELGKANFMSLLNNDKEAV